MVCVFPKRAAVGIGSIGCVRIESGRFEPTWKLCGAGQVFHSLDAGFLADVTRSSRVLMKAARLRAQGELELGMNVE